MDNVFARMPEEEELLRRLRSVHRSKDFEESVFVFLLNHSGEEISSFALSLYVVHAIDRLPSCYGEREKEYLIKTIGPKFIDALSDNPNFAVHAKTCLRVSYP